MLMDSGLNPYDYSLEDGYKFLRYKVYTAKAEKRAIEKAKNGRPRN